MNEYNAALSAGLDFFLLENIDYSQNVNILQKEILCGLDMRILLIPALGILGILGY